MGLRGLVTQGYTLCWRISPFQGFCGIRCNEMAIQQRSVRPIDTETESESKTESEPERNRNRNGIGIENGIGTRIGNGNGNCNVILMLAPKGAMANCLYLG
jgi:hypothetical protein